MKFYSQNYKFDLLINFVSYLFYSHPNQTFFVDSQFLLKSFIIYCYLLHFQSPIVKDSNPV